jgi:hypothetical protein
MSRHLNRARDLLRERLARQGVALPAALLAALLTERALYALVPALLSDSTIQAAIAFASRSALPAGSASAEAMALAEGMLKAMTMTKLKAAVAVVLTLTLVGIGTGGAFQTSEKRQEAGAPAAAASPDKSRKRETGQSPTVGDSAAVLSQRVHQIREKLDGPITLENGVDANTKFRDAMEFLSDRYDIALLINTQAFSEATGAENVEDMPVRLPKLVRVSLDTVLTLLMAQVEGAYLIHRDYIEIVPRKRAWPEEWTPDVRHIVPNVTANFRERALDQALKELADQAGISVILDERATGHARSTRVTARFEQSPLDTAVALLADMGDLNSVAMDNVLYVTSKANALAIRAERQPPRSHPEKEQSKTKSDDKRQVKVSESTKK